MKAANRILNSVWTLEYECHDDDTITIINYGRDDDEGYQRERDLLRCRVYEDEGRIVREVEFAEYAPFRFDSQGIYKVRNPQHVFSYC